MNTRRKWTGLLAGAPARAACLVALMATTADAAGPNPPSTAAPIQAWVFDGAYQPSAVFGVAFTDAGLLAHIANGLVCPGGASIATGFVSLGPAQVGVYPVLASEPLGFGPALDPSFFPASPPDPINPALVVNDCVALQNEAAVQAYIADRHAEIGAIGAQLQTCVQDVEQLACQMQDAIVQAEAKCLLGDPMLCGIISLPATPSEDGGSPSEGIEFDSACGQALKQMGQLVAQAAGPLAGCQSARGYLQTLLATIQAFLSGQSSGVGGLDLYPWLVQSEVDRAEEAGKRLEAILADFAGEAGACSHQSLVEGCDLFPGELPPGPPEPPDAVKVRLSGRHLGRVAGAFQSASRATSDTVLRERYADLARRLRRLPDERVLDLTAPTDKPFSQSFVALRRADLPDDGRSPLAVVLTFVRSRRCPPELNLADRQLLDQTLETFKSTLAPGRTCPTCEPPR